MTLVNSIRTLEHMDAKFIEQSQQLLQRLNARGNRQPEHDSILVITDDNPKKRARKAIEAPDLTHCTFSDLASYSLDALRKAAKTAGVDISRLRQKQAVLAALSEHCLADEEGEESEERTETLTVRS